MVDRVICSGFHWTFGWVRRSDLDDLHDKGFAYEEPNGDLVYCKLPRHKHGVYLDQVENEAGERRLVASQIPKVVKSMPSRMRK